MNFRDILMAAATQGGGAIVYDTDAQAYFTAAEGAGATFTAGLKGHINTLVLGLKTDSLWTKLDRLWLFANETAAGALMDIKGLDTATAVNTPTFTANQGYAGNGSTSYINTTFNPSTDGSAYTQNSAHMMLYNRTARTSGAGSPSNCGTFNGSTILSHITPYGGSDAQGGLNDLTPVTVAYQADASGCWIISRTSSSAQALYRAGASIASSGASNSVGINNLAVFVGGLNNSGSLGFATADQHAAFSAGGALDATEAANLNTRIEAYMDALGTGVQ